MQSISDSKWAHAEPRLHGLALYLRLCAHSEWCLASLALFQETCSSDVWERWRLAMKDGVKRKLRYFRKKWNWIYYMATSQNVKPRSIPWTHRPIHTPDPYQNAGDPDRSIRLDHRGPIHTRILTQLHIFTCVIDDRSVWETWLNYGDGSMDVYGMSIGP